MIKFFYRCIKLAGIVIVMKLNKYLKTMFRTKINKHEVGECVKTSCINCSRRQISLGTSNQGKRDGRKSEQ
jgi:hypothetical protein